MGYFPGEYDDNTSEAEIRDLCMNNARNHLIKFNEKAEFFSITKKDAEVKIQKSDNNVSISNIDFSSLGRNAGILKVGKMDSGGYAVVVGGIINKSGEFENMVDGFLIQFLFP